MFIRTGVLWEYQGNYAEAERYFYEGVQIAQHLGQREMLCYLFNNLGDIAFNRGEFARANAYCQQGQELARQIQHRALLSILLITQGECLLAQHDYSQARHVLHEAVAIARQIKHAEFLSLALCNLGKAIGYVEAYACSREQQGDGEVVLQRQRIEEKLCPPGRSWCRPESHVLRGAAVTRASARIESSSSRGRATLTPTLSCVVQHVQGSRIGPLHIIDERARAGPLARAARGGSRLQTSECTPSFHPRHNWQVG